MRLVTQRPAHSARSRTQLGSTSVGGDSSRSSDMSPGDASRTRAAPWAAPWAEAPAAASTRRRFGGGGPVATPSWRSASSVAASRSSCACWSGVGSERHCM